METAGDRRLRRVMLAVLVAVLALPVIAFVALWIWAEANRDPPPAMFADVPWDVREDGPWAARMAATFPPGTSETVLVRRLRDEGFEVDAATRSATYDWSSFPCNHDVRVGWSVEAGRVTRSFVRYMNACP